jgi:glycosyltransferase involved in cell wall biosynthesis
MRVLILIPAYNEAAHIAEVVKGVLRQGLDVLVVDDCSSDETGARAAEAGAVVLRHDVNGGKGRAITTGFAYAVANGYDAVLSLDGDGQHDPEDIPAFLQMAGDERIDVIIGTRMRDVRTMPLVRRVTNRVLSLLISLTAHAKITDTQSGYRLVRTHVWGAFPMQSHSFDFESEFLLRAGRLGFRVAEVRVRTIYGDEVSKINPLKESLRFARLFVRALRYPCVLHKRRAGALPAGGVRAGATTQ